MSTIKVTNLQNPSAASPAIVLDANSRATLNGLSYPTEGSLSGRNRVINGSMTVDQRNAGASVTAGLGFPVDRFQVQTGCDATFSYQRDTVAPTGFTNSLKVTTTLADTNLTTDQYGRIMHRIEGFNLAGLNFGTASAVPVTLSFWVRSSVTGTFGGSFANDAFNRSYPFTYTISAANTWEYKTVTFTADTTGTWLSDNGCGLLINWSLGAASNLSGTAGSWSGSTLISATGATGTVGTLNATFYLTGVQLESGSTSTPFERRSYGQELALCQRYYYRIGGNSEVGTSAYTMMASGMLWNTGSGDFCVPFKVAMRSAPSITYGGNVAIQYQTTQSSVTSQTTVDGTTKNTAFLRMNTAQSWAAGPGCSLGALNDTTAFVAFSSEL